MGILFLSLEQGIYSYPSRGNRNCVSGTCVCTLYVCDVLNMACVYSEKKQNKTKNVNVTAKILPTRQNTPFPFVCFSFSLGVKRQRE